MNPVDHPHGGGEGKTRSEEGTLATPWGKLTKGPKTRNVKNKDQSFDYSKTYIINHE